ncbi:putative alkyl hydroperoxide reductase, subunit F [Burkholderia pseudomallei]|nr:putative alkyl hydroperoxide reductase, subunit F [Burkholderia pseudomallei]
MVGVVGTSVAANPAGVSIRTSGQTPRSSPGPQPSPGAAAMPFMRRASRLRVDARLAPIDTAAIRAVGQPVVGMTAPLTRPRRTIPACADTAR